MKRIKKDCVGCRASFNSHNETPFTCYLNYKQEDGIPKEICPKPRTVTEMVKLSFLTKSKQIKG